MQQRLALAAGGMAVLAGPALAFDLPTGTDPVFAQAYYACLSGAAGGLPQGDGWISHDTGDVEAQAWNNWTGAFATNDLEIGAMSLSATVEHFPGYIYGECSLRLNKPERQIAAPDLEHVAGIIGAVERSGEDWSGLWHDEAGTMFVRSLMSSNAEQFRLSITTITAAP
jgi:hypothetical protein